MSPALRHVIEQCFDTDRVNFLHVLSTYLYKGRQKRVDDAEIRRLASNGVAKAQIARDLRISRMSVYRALNEATQK